MLSLLIKALNLLCLSLLFGRNKLYLSCLEHLAMHVCVAIHGNDQFPRWRPSWSHITVLLCYASGQLNLFLLVNLGSNELEVWRIACLGWVASVALSCTLAKKFEHVCCVRFRLVNYPHSVGFYFRYRLADSDVWRSYGIKQR